MKKIFLIMLTVFLNMALFSCSPQSVNDDNAPQACCGEDDHIPPPPPGEDGGSGG